MKKLAIVVLLAGGCDQAPPPPAPPPPVSAKPEPDHIEVQHILISFDSKVPGATRSQAEAEKMAAEILARVKKGEDFERLMQTYSDDKQGLPVYKMSNHKVQPESEEEFPRGQMVAAFGDVGFPLAVGEVGLATYDPVKSKYGWHIIKRVK